MRRIIKKRLHQAFFYVFCPVLFSAAYPVFAESTTPCQTTGFDRQISINHVIDGDTVITSEGEHIRLLGIDTPEIDHTNNLSQPGAEEARAYLTKLVAGHDPLRLTYDQEQRDRFGRTLGHLSLPDGTNIQSELLARGLALAFIYPPNLEYAACYKDIANAARRRSRGIWRLPDYRTLAAKDLTSDTTGYRIIRGTVESIDESKRLLILHLTPRFSINIPKQDLVYFENMDINTLKDHLIQAEGIVYMHNKYLRMRIRHPLNLTILSSAD